MVLGYSTRRPFLFLLRVVVVFDSGAISDYQQQQQQQQY